MADVFLNKLSDGVQSVPAPYLTATLIPSADRAVDVNSLGLRVPLGFGTTTRRFLPEDMPATEGPSQAAEVARIVQSVTQQASYADSIRFDVQGIVGPIGPQGPPGPPGIGIVGGVGLGTKGDTGAAGEDAFDNIDIPIPYDGWEGAFTDNSPGAGSVAWTSFKIKYQGTEYTISASNTSDEYLYWDHNSTPTSLQSTATRSNAVGVGKFPVGWNNSGTFNPSNFMKLITAGFLSVADLSALNITVGTADIDNLAVTTLKINDTDVTGDKLNEDAKPIISSGSDTGTGVGSSWVTVASCTHATLGEVAKSFAQITFTSGTGSGTLILEYNIKYDGTIVKSDSISMGGSTSAVRQLEGFGLASAGSITALVEARKTNGTHTVTADGFIQVEEERV